MFALYMFFVYLRCGCDIMLIHESTLKTTLMFNLYLVVCMMKKRYFINVLLLVAVFAGCIGLASCDDEDENTPYSVSEEVWTVMPYKGLTYPMDAVNSKYSVPGYVITDESGYTFTLSNIQGFDDIYQEGHEYVVRVKCEVYLPDKDNSEQMPRYRFILLELISDTPVTDYEVKDWPPFWWPRDAQWPPEGWNDDDTGTTE